MNSFKIKVYFVLLIFCYGQKLSTQTYVQIPDPIFASYLQGLIPSAVSNGSLNTSNPLVSGLQIMSVSNSAITDLTGIQYFSGLSILNIVGVGITTLAPLPVSVQSLVCVNTSITSLPTLPNSLQRLQCQYNLLTNLPTLPNNLQEMDCSGNFLTTLPILPNSLQRLTCALNSLTSLPQLPPALQMLNCQANLISGLPILPASLEYLSCYENPLNNLPILPSNLVYLNCQYCFLTTLPALPGALQSLICNNNQLSGISNLPVSLTQLICNSNSLTLLPPLPSSLLTLECTHNQLTALPSLPNGLKVLLCHNNNITCFPIFPNSIKYPESTNSGLRYYLSILNNPITCLPNYLIPQMAAVIMAYPLCAPGNVNGCPDGIVGLDEASSEFSSVQIYPNPSSGRITVVSSNMQINILGGYDTMGKLVLSKEINGKTELDLDLPDGVYIFNIKSGTHSVSKKVIVVTR